MVLSPVKVCELNGWIDLIDVCENVLKLILILIPNHVNIIYVAKPDEWLNGMLV